MVEGYLVGRQGIFFLYPKKNGDRHCVDEIFY